MVFCLLEIPPLGGVVGLAGVGWFPASARIWESWYGDGRGEGVSSLGGILVGVVS
jgi:hypothetical protein